ncbi:MAG: ABC transporter permease [Thermotogae bacterium]|nr:ABC transporter permease [Thermotogota bacterium]
MKIIRLGQGFFLSTFREFGSSFWILIFPLILYMIMCSIFGHFDEGNMGIRLGVVYEDKLGGPGKIIEMVLSEISGKNGPFEKTEYATREEGLEALKKDTIDVLFVVPKKTSIHMLRAMLGGGKGGLPPASLLIFYVEGRTASRIGANIIENIMDSINLEATRRRGGFYRSFNVAMEPIRKKEAMDFDFRYYFFPGVMLTAIISTSVFSFPIGFLEMRKNGLTRRLLATPITPLQFFWGYVFGMFMMVGLSIIGLYALAYFVYGVKQHIWEFKFIAMILYSIFTLFSLGLMLSAFARKQGTTVAISNIANYILMFLGGLYFPVFQVPFTLKIIVYSLPSTYLVEGFRKFFGYDIAGLSWVSIFGVPAIWATVSLVIFSLRFKKVMGYE